MSEYGNFFLQFILANLRLDQFRDLQIVVFCVCGFFSFFKFQSFSFGNFKDCVEIYLKPLIQDQKDLVLLGNFNYNLFAGHVYFLSYLWKRV